MNNRYTFKAKRKDNCEWVYGLLIRKRDLTFNNEYDEFYAIQDDFFEEYRIDEQTLSQCTGLQDKDDNYIFENDIVELNNIEFRVDWSCGCFEFSHDCDIDKNCDDADYINPIDYKLDECKIIGNKFDKEVE